jgi:hypothetical protein
MGYSDGFVAALSDVVTTLRDQPDTEVRVRVGSDTVCRACPSLGPGGCLRYGMGVVEQDARVAEVLGVQSGDVMPWADVQQKVRENVAPDDLTTLCAGCPWLEYGVCAEGIADLRAGKGITYGGR